MGPAYGASAVRASSPRAGRESPREGDARRVVSRQAPRVPLPAAVLPLWARGYERAWLRADAVAGIVIASVVVPQAVAYAQIAGLPPQAGLMAAPGAMIAYALLGTSRTLVVSATTAASAVSAAAVGPLAGGDTAKFAALSAALALVTAIVLAVSGALKLGAIADLVSKPVMTGFLFGLGLTIIVSQAPSLLGVDGGDGDFFDRVRTLLDELGDIHVATLAVGVASIVVLVLGRRVLPWFPSTLLTLLLAIVASAVLNLDDHGVAIVGDLPSALPDLAVPDVGASDLVDLIAPALGILVLSAEGLGVARSLATAHGYQVDPNRDLMALGASNLVAGLSSGFVQSGGASQTAAAEGAGGRTQLATLLAGVLVLLTGAFLAPLFEHLPQATLAAIVIVAVTGFLRADELARFARIRTSAIVFAGLALLGVLTLGVLQGLVVTAGLTLVDIIRRFSRPGVARLARDPVSGAWGAADRHPEWELPDGVVVVRYEGPLFYPNAVYAKDATLALGAGAPRIVLDLSSSADLDVAGLDALGELAAAVPELWVAAPHVLVRKRIRAAGLEDRMHLAPTIDAAITPTG
jgi:high affinity sulfate transporter 1